MFKQSEEGEGFGGIISSYYYVGNSAVNYNIIRYADVLLWAAEAEVQAGNIDQARTYVNMVRSRAMNGCTVAIDYSSGSPSANYSIGLYTTPWTSQSYAMAAIAFERRLEFAEEGQRFFDLVRWGNAGTYLNAFLQVEKTRGVCSVLSTADFTSCKNEYYPIPQQEIILDPQLKQNSGY